MYDKDNAVPTTHGPDDHMKCIESLFIHTRKYLDLESGKKTPSCRRKAPACTDVDRKKVVRKGIRKAVKMEKAHKDSKEGDDKKKCGSPSRCTRSNLSRVAK